MPYNSCRTCLTNHMRFISRHITSLVINSLGCGDTHTHAHTRTRIPMICTGSILRNQVHVGLRPACALFKNGDILQTKLWKIGKYIATNIACFIWTSIHAIHHMYLGLLLSNHWHSVKVFKIIIGHHELAGWSRSHFTHIQYLEGGIHGKTYCKFKAVASLVGIETHDTIFKLFGIL